MEVVVGVNVHDEPNLLFKVQRKIKVFHTSDPLPNRGYCLVANASKYGAVFVGTPDGKLAVYRLNELIDKEFEPCHLPVQLQEKPTHLAVNSDQELLAVTGGRLFVLFKVTNLLNQNVSPSMSVQFDVSPSTYVTDVKWNPCVPDTIAYAFYDGSIVICQAGQGLVKKLQTSARCICWSPKGKQLVVGNSDGTICQYKPDLSLMKSFPAPNLFNGAPVEVLVIHWISTFQFAVVYKTAMDNSKPAVTIVNTPKGGQLSCQNCEDICYSMGSSRPWYYYLQGLPQWNMILCSSSNSMEIATLGSTDGATWEHWCQSDEARAELPMTDKKQENYPVGISIDTAAIHQLPWGENEKLPFMPTLLVLSQTGLLTLFNIINLNNQAPQICTPVTAIGAPFPAQSQPIAPAAAPHPKPPQTTAAPDPALSFGAPGPLSPGAEPGLQQQPLEQQQQQQQEVPPLEFSNAPEPAPTSQIDHAQEFNAALKADQEAANKQKADLEFKNMLIREVNEFQVELYKFLRKTREEQNKFYHELHAIDTNAELKNLDAATLEKDCSVEDLRSSIIALKLDLVRACAIVAEARTHSDAKDLDQWTQADPLTTKRVASVKKLSYYVQSQLEQAHKALEYKWNKIAERDMHSNKPGPRMIRPIIDDVYQTLVKQQEILSQREADLKVLKNMLNECDGSPVYKSTRILRNTPFKNKDPLSKLTKNIINMSLEPQKTENKSLLTPQKLDALRDMLSNHKTVKIKPVNVEMKHHMAAIRMRYEKSVKEKTAAPLFLNTDHVPISVEFKSEIKSEVPSGVPAFIIRSNQGPISPHTQGPPDQAGPEQTAPAFVITSTPIAPKNNNAFGEQLQTISPHTQGPPDQAGTEQTAPAFVITSTPIAPKNNNALREQLQTISPHTQGPPDQAGPEQTAPAFVITSTSVSSQNNNALGDQLQTISPHTQGPPDQAGPEQTAPAFNITSTSNAPENKNALGNLLQNKQVTVEVKKDVNIMKNLMGQSICSPTNLNFSSIIEATPTSFTTKPISALNDMLSQLGPQAVVSDNKSSATGEPDPNVKEEKMSHLFKMSTSTPKPNSQNRPDVLGNSNMITIKRVEPKSFLPTQTEESKENVTIKSENVILSVSKVIKEDKKENDPKVASVQNTNKPLLGSVAQPVATSPAFTSKAGDAHKSIEGISKLETEVPKATPKPATPASSASIFASANATMTALKPKSIFGSTALTSSTPTESFQSISVSKSDSPGTSIFGTPLSSASTKTEPSSIFGSANSIPKTQSSSIFSATSSTPSSVFGTSTTSIFGTATTTQSSGAATTPISAAKPAESTSSSAASTQSSMFGSTAKSVFSSAVFASTTTSSPSESTTSKPSSVFGKTSLPLLTTTTTANTQAATSTQSLFGSTATTSTTPTTTQSVFGTPASTTSSIFGSVNSTTQPSVFGGTPTSTTSVSGTTATTSASVFRSTISTSKTTTTQASTTPPTSVFGSPTTTQAPSSGSSTTQASIFGGTTTQTSIFGSTTSTPTSATTTQVPALGSTTTTPSSVFGSTATTQSSVFGNTATTAKSVFGSAASQASAFGSPATTPTPAFGSTATTQSSVFGTPTITQASVFGSTGANQTSVFGSPATTQASVFGSPATTQSVFGSPATSQASVFGTATSQPSVFGSSATTQSVFGAPQTTQSSAFGSAQTTQASVFGSPASQTSVFGQTNQASVFGTPSPPASVFGTPTQTTQASVFGTPATTTQASVFGSPAQSVFGTPATTAQSGSLFGSGDSLFSSVNISTTNASQSGGSIFGGGSTATSGFGGSTNVFGGKTTFGQSNPTAEAIFGGGGGGFGQTSQANNFWGSNNNSSGGFGSSGFGQQATTQSSAVFGTGSFSAPSPPGGAFGSPAPSTGGFGSGFGSKAVFGQPAGFGSPTSSGFGAPAAFGGFNKSPGGFGASASFGGAPAFGGSAFGSTSPGGAFGSNAPSTGFGSPTQSNATFESLATQNTLTFGNLAQQTAQPAQPAPSFNTSPSFTGWRG